MRSSDGFSKHHRDINALKSKEINLKVVSQDFKSICLLGFFDNLACVYPVGCLLVTTTASKQALLIRGQSRTAKDPMSQDSIDLGCPSLHQLVSSQANRFHT